MSKMGISTLQSYCGAQIFEAIGLDKAFVDRYFTWTASRIGGVGIDVIAREVRERHQPRVPAAQPARDRSRDRRRIPVAPRRRAPPLQPRDRAQAAARDAQRPVRDLQGIHRDRQRPEPQARHAARPARVQADADADAARRGRAGRGDPQAVRHRRDVVRLDQPGGARDDRHRDEPAGRQVEHRRRGRGPGPVSPGRRTATRAAAPSSRWPRRGSA